MLLSFLSSVSWLQFLIVFGIATIAWAVYVYKDVLLGKSPPADDGPATKRIWNVQEVEPPPASPQQTLFDNDGAPITDDQTDEEDDDQQEEDMTPDEEFDDGVFDDLENLAEKINDIFSSNTAITDKEQLIELLTPVVSGFPSLNRLPFKVAIHNLIERQAQQNYNIVVTKAETDNLWTA